MTGLKETFTYGVKNQMGQVHEVSGFDKIPALVLKLAKQLKINPKAVAFPDAALKDLNWKGLQVEHRSAEIEDALGISLATAGIAETGTLVFIAGKSAPPSVNFVPTYSIAIVHETDLVNTTEEVWALLKERDTFPGTINLVTGPSKTGDIEQTLFLGAHGPKELHVVIVKT